MQTLELKLPFFLFVLLFLFQFSSFAQEQTVEIEALLQIKAPPSQPFEVVTSELRVVSPQEVVTLEKQNVTLKRVSEREVEVRLSRPISLIYYGPNGPETKQWESFRLRETPYKIDLMMQTQRGDHMLRRRTETEAVDQFIKDLKGQEITDKRAQYEIKGAPTEVTQVRHLEMIVRAYDIFRSPSFTPVSIRYNLNLVAPETFSGKELKKVTRDLKSLRPLGDFKTPYWESYMMAHKNLRDGIAKLRDRGWGEGLRLTPSRKSSPVTFHESSEVRVLYPSCRKVFTH